TGMVLSLASCRFAPLLSCQIKTSTSAHLGRVRKRHARVAQGIHGPTTVSDVLRQGRARAEHQGRMELGRPYVPARAAWLSDLKAELLAFPTGKHDDLVEALGLAGQLLDRWAPRGVPKIEPSNFRPLNDCVERYPRPDELLSLKVL